MRFVLSIVLALVALTGVVSAAPAARVVSIGGDVTEIVYELGEEGRLVGVDQTSVWPKDAAKFPQVGYVRNLSAEGILSLKPDLILASKVAGPAAVLDQLRDAKVTVVSVTGDDNVAGVISKIDNVAKALGAGSGTTYTDGLGTPAAMARPSTTLCSRGSSSWVTGRAREVDSTTR